MNWCTDGPADLERPKSAMKTSYIPDAGTNHEAEADVMAEREVIGEATKFEGDRSRF